MIRWLAERWKFSNNQVAFTDHSNPLPGQKSQHRVRMIVRSVQRHIASGIGTPTLAGSDPQRYIQSEVRKFLRWIPGLKVAQMRRKRNSERSKSVVLDRHLERWLIVDLIVRTV
jgi:hypothetical protein